MSEELVNQVQESDKNNEKQDLLEQLLKPEVQESLTYLVEQLPKLAEMVGLLTKAYDYAQQIATDDVLKSDTVNAVKEISAPVIGTVKNFAQTAIEAKDRAEESSKEVIGLFGVLKMLKNPEVQKLLRFANAFLEVSAERKNQ